MKLRTKVAAYGITGLALAGAVMFSGAIAGIFWRNAVSSGERYNMILVGFDTLASQTVTVS